jgi:hypothetical protein
VFALAVAFAQTLLTPIRDHPIVGYSGIPQIASPNLTIVSHNVTLAISKDRVDISSVTLFKNNGPAGSYVVTVPIWSMGGAPTPSPITASWADAPVSWEPTSSTVAVQVQNQGSYALRIKYSQNHGSSGADRMKHLVAYDLHSAGQVGTLMVTFTFAPDSVFHLPDVGPGAGWEVGPKGAFLKREGYAGRSGVAYCSFYPAGFD